MNVELKYMTNRKFKELNVGDTFLKGDMGRVYMKTANGEGYTRHNPTFAVCLNSGYFYDVNPETEVWKINGSFVEDGARNNS